MSEIARLAKARGWGPRLFFDQIAALLPLGGYVKGKGGEHSGGKPHCGYY